MNSKSMQLIKTFIVVLLVPCIMRVINKLLGLLGLSLLQDEIARFMISEAGLAILALIALFLLGRGDALKIKDGGWGEGLKAGTYMIVMTIISLLAFVLLFVTGQTEIKVGTVDIFFFILLIFFIGLSEEILYRGLIQNALHDFFGEDSYGHVRTAIILSGIFFGLIHLGNILSGESVTGTICQVIGVIPLGIIMGAMYYRSHRNLWVNIILHAIYDGAGLLAGGVLGGKELVNALESTDPLKALIIAAITLLIGLFVSRKKKIQIL